MALLSLDFDSDQALKDVLTHGGRILLVLVIALIAVRVITSVITPLVRIAVREQLLGEPQIEADKRIETVSHVISRTVVVVAMVAVILTALPELGLNVGPLIAGVGIIGIAIGLGAQNLVRDVVNGLFILLENQYSEGDTIKIGDVSGLVEDLNLRRTVLRDLDGVVHFIPHGEVKTASNMTRGFSRVNLNVAVGQKTDLGKAFQAIDGVGAELARDPQWSQRIREAPRALRVDKLGDASVEIKIVGVTEPGEQWAVTGELRRRLTTALAEVQAVNEPAPGGERGKMDS